MSNASRVSDFSLRLIRRLCREELVEELEGNLLEYREVITGPFRKIKYWYQVLNYLRPGTLKIFHVNAQSMFHINPKLTFRNLYRQGSTSVINLLGFTIGLTATIFLYFYIYDQLTVDNFHKDGNMIYRAIRQSAINGAPYKIGVTSSRFAPALANDFSSSVTAHTQAMKETGLVSVGQRQFFEENILFASSSFFDFFSYPLAYGDPQTVLSEPNSAVLSKAVAEKYFGDIDPIGQEIDVDHQYSFVVTGIFDDMPSKSHLQYDLVFSLQVFERFDWYDDWWNNMMMTYVKIPTKAQAAHVESQLKGFMDKYFGDDFERSGRRIDLTLEPLGDIYFNRNTRYDQAEHGHLGSIYILLIVAIGILFIGSFNYVNLSIAHSFARAREVGVRKVLGVHKRRLAAQFLSEAATLFVISAVCAILLTELLSPAFESLFGMDLALDWFGATTLLFLGALSLGILLASGIYPAMLLASFLPITAMQGKIASGKNVHLRKGLVIVQFTISIFLIGATWFISKQMHFLNDKDLGFDNDGIITVNLYSGEARSQRDLLIDRLESNPHVHSVTRMTGEPGGFHDASVFQVTGVAGDHRFRTVFTDGRYAATFDLKVIAGRDLDQQIQTDLTDGMLINRRALEELGVSAEEVLGKKIDIPSFGIRRKLIGVVEDYHFGSLHGPIEPLAIIGTEGWGSRLAIKTKGSPINALEQIEETYSELIPAFPMRYEFLDDRLRRLYEDEQRQSRVFSGFSAVSVFLACLGIFGLAAYSARQRQKELGIRKVLGATISQIISLISKEFVTLVLIAGVVATPLVWYFADQWLSSFTYRIVVWDYWYIFIASSLLAVAIALLTVTFKTYGAAVSDPTESLRNE